MRGHVECNGRIPLIELGFLIRKSSSTGMRSAEGLAAGTRRVQITAGKQMRETFDLTAVPEAIYAGSSRCSSYVLHKQDRATFQRNINIVYRIDGLGRRSRHREAITVILIVALVIAAFVCAIIGSKLYLGLLFAAIIVPCVIYVIIWVRGVLDNAYGRKIVDKKDELTEDVASEEKQDKA